MCVPCAPVYIRIQNRIQPLTSGHLRAHRSARECAKQSHWTMPQELSSASHKHQHRRANTPGSAEQQARRFGGSCGVHSSGSKYCEWTGHTHTRAHRAGAEWPHQLLEVCWRSGARPVGFSQPTYRYSISIWTFSEPIRTVYRPNGTFNRVIGRSSNQIGHIFVEAKRQNSYGLPDISNVHLFVCIMIPSQLIKCSPNSWRVHNNLN